jgi:hypothetical protein
VLGIGVTGAR